MKLPKGIVGLEEEQKVRFGIRSQQGVSVFMLVLQCAEKESGRVSGAGPCSVVL